ncbi:MAG: trigger factor [Elusimicrobia bacterium RIFOXYB2_FULL_49_7]|nr:MAG: trigger factor [Elusimicrobia bacterium RIFOXYB2_FULL_49_7]
MKVSVQEKGAFKRQLSVEVDAESIQKKFDDMFQTYKKEVSLPGFRPGKVPRDMILKRFGKALRSEAIEALVSSSFKDACTQEKLAPISKPVISKLTANENEPLQYEAEFEIDPPVVIEKYRDLDVKIETIPVEEKDVDTVLSDLQERVAVLKPVDRPIRKGDFAELEYKKVIIDGREKSDYQNPKYPVEIGSSRLSMFEDRLIGLSKDEEKTVEFTFPADYSFKDVAGKPASFTLLIKQVKEKEIPALTDDFAKEIAPDVKDLEELKKRIREDLAAENQRKAFEKASGLVLDKVIEQNPFDIPDSRIDDYLAISYESFQKQYPKSEVTPEEFREKNRELVVRDFKKYRIIEAVAAKESLKASQEEADEEVKRIADYRGEDFDKVKAALRKSGQMMDIRENLKERKVLNFLLGVKEDKPEIEKK